ncbi:MAG: carbohydrate binding family 9 domain-containing protein, partial [Gemmatimonadetes bacterium]|nr:carbohydrate binding family 9 domain-containing protein [Gemmatimonadota bacterium]
MLYFRGFMGDTGRIIGIALLVGSGSLSVLAAQDNKIITALYVEAPIVIDGNLDEPQWSLAQAGGDFIQNEPRTGEPATEQTEVRILFDDENLYIGVYCFDSAGKEGITVTEIKRDYRPFDNDLFSFVIDTFDDNRNGFMFGTNPKGAQREGQVEGDGDNRNFDWDAIWYVKAKITEQGWQAEFAIP